MFTGIISNTGIFKQYRHGKQEIAVEAPTVSPRINIGESIAVDGVCLSLIGKENNTLFFNLSQETLQKTSLGFLRRGQKLNLELSLTLSSLLNGHLVTGHIDTRGKVLKIIEKKPGRRLTVSFPQELRKFFVPKGSVAINGVSLTVCSLDASSFEMELIPITLKNTNLGELRRGGMVNIECDIIGKYVCNWLNEGKKQSYPIKSF